MIHGLEVYMSEWAECREAGRRLCVCNASSKLRNWEVVFWYMQKGGLGEIERTKLWYKKMGCAESGLGGCK